MAPPWIHPVTRTSTENLCSAINGTAGQRGSLGPDPKAFAVQIPTRQVVFVRGGSCRGLLLEEKPELKRVLEQRRLELHREEEMAQRRPSDLETELRKRQQKLEEVRVAVTAANEDILLEFGVKLRCFCYNPARLSNNMSTIQSFTTTRD